MAINESLSATGQSATTLPTDVMSLVMVDGTWSGRVALQSLRPGASEWVTLWHTATDASVGVTSPDSGVTYRFDVTVTSGTVNVYFGP